MVSARKASKRLRSKLSAISKQRESDAYKRQLKGRNVDVATDTVRLSYGPEMGAVLTGGGVVTGGKVKLTHLYEQYPHQETRFNILYLVSSALPKHAVMLVRWAKHYGVKVVLNQNGVAYPGWTDDYQAINAELQEILTASDLVLYQSRFCKESADRFAGKPTARWEIVNNCVDIEHFKPSNRQRNGSIMLLVAGTHHQRERVVLPLYILKELLAKNISASLKVLGPLAWEGAAGEVEDLSQQLNVAAETDFLGSYRQEEAPFLYQKGDMLLHFKYKDPCPNVVIEALACGLPVIGSQSGGLPELVGKHAGMLLPVGDSWEQLKYPQVGDVTRAVLEVGRNLDAFQQAARRRAEDEFSAQCWVKRHKILFEELIFDK